MKIDLVMFERAQMGWICTIGFRFTSAKQFTDEYQAVQVGRRWWIAAYFAARLQAKFHIAVHGAKKGEREAKGWAACLLALASLLLLPATVWGQTSASAARSALALSLSQAPAPPVAPPVRSGCNCNLGDPCLCPMGLCECLRCQCQPPFCKPAPMRLDLTYSEGVDECLKSDAKLLVWVKQAPCPECEPNMIHCRWDAFPGVSGPCVVVGGMYHGVFSRLAVLPGKPTEAQIEREVQVWQENPTSALPSSSLWGNGRSQVLPAVPQGSPVYSGGRRGASRGSC